MKEVERKAARVRIIFLEECCTSTGCYAPTALSRFRSHRSLMVHPAPRMINAPVPKRRMYFRGTDGGTLSAYDAMVIDQANEQLEMVGNHTHITRIEEAAERTHCRDRIAKGFRWACQCE